MTDFTHKLTRTWTDGSNRTTTGTITKTGGAEINLEETVPIGAATLVNCPLSAAGVKELHIQSDQDMVVTFKDALGATVGTPLVLFAGKPYQWSEDDDFVYNPSPLGSSDIAVLSCNTAVQAVLKVRALDDPTPPTVALTGTAVACTESQLVTGGRTFILTLSGGAQWIAAGASSFDLVRTAIFQGIRSAQAEAAGWNVQVQGAFVVSNVVRTSATVVTVTSPAAGSYSVTANETLTAIVPPQAVTTRHALIASPVAVVTANS